MSRWRTVVRRELARFREETSHDVVSRQAFLNQALPTLREEFPDNSYPGQKVSQVFQQLRDRGEIEFIDRGVYRILDLGSVPVATGEPTVEDGACRYTATEYETTIGARSIPSAFREAILGRYGDTCPVSGVDHRRLLDVAHVVPWSDDESRRTDPRNVLPLSKTHHAAFDAGLFTLDEDAHLHVSPSFETDSSILRRTLVDRAGERVDLPPDALDEDGLERHNRALSWW